MSLRLVVFVACFGLSVGGDSLTLRLVNGSVATIVNSTSPGSAGNSHGYEDGSVVREGNTTHMFVTEMFGAPMWIKTRLAHWQTTAAAGDRGWQRSGTISLDGEDMVSTANCSDPADIRHNAALWSPVLYKECHPAQLNCTWYMSYVGYNCGRGYSNANTDGEIKLAKSTAGVAGPFISVPTVLLKRDNTSKWEGKQGVDSFFPFQPHPQGAPGQQLLAFFGSSRFGWPWNVGLAQSTSGSILGPWEPFKAANPLNLDGGKVENPIVLSVLVPASQERLLVMVHDWVTGGSAGFGMTWSRDGLSWSNSSMVTVPGGVEAPLGVLPSLTHSGGLTVWWNKRGRYDNLFAAQFDVLWNGQLVQII